MRSSAAMFLRTVRGGNSDAAFTLDHARWRTVAELVLGKMRKTIQCVVICLPLIFAGCSDTDGETAGAENWTILVRTGSQETSWRLEGNAVPKILIGAKAFLERELAKATHDLERNNITAILSGWDSYSCQLLPVIEKQEGRKVVIMSFFPTRYKSGDFKNWRSVPIRVEGGGYAFWTVSYDPKKGEYFSFWVNAIQ